MDTTTTKTAALITAEGRGSLVWPRFTPGLLLLDEDLTAGVDYTRELSRLLFRNLFGCGVICGLTVTGKEATGRCLTVDVDCGLALDCIGDPVQVRQPQSLTIMATCDKTLPSAVWVVLRRREHDCMPRELACPPEAGVQSLAKTRTIDAYEIAVLDHRPEGGQRPQPPSRPMPRPPLRLPNRRPPNRIATRITGTGSAPATAAPGPNGCSWRSLHHPRRGPPRPIPSPGTRIIRCAASSGLCCCPTRS